MYQPSPVWTFLAPDPYEESTDKPLLFTQVTTASPLLLDKLRLIPKLISRTVPDM
jgi:hypothetical protein